uniref:Uncharacterized protein n=1 Tax=Mesocestoides corti TaxID=53468 RepID=A0A5K3FEL0_MESCO
MHAPVSGQSGSSCWFVSSPPPPSPPPPPPPSSPLTERVVSEAEEKQAFVVSCLRFPPSSPKTSLTCPMRRFGFGGLSSSNLNITKCVISTRLKLRHSLYSYTDQALVNDKHRRRVAVFVWNSAGVEKLADHHACCQDLRACHFGVVHVPRDHRPCRTIVDIRPRSLRQVDVVWAPHRPDCQCEASEKPDLSDVGNVNG